MQAIKTKLKDCYILEPDKFGDDRGYFSPYFIQEFMEKNGFEFGEVRQLNRSLSGKGIIRGLHFQKDPKCQAKIVECLQGAILDVVVDIREGSETYGQWISVLLTPENGRQLLVPRGYAHGFLSLKDQSLFQYIVDNDYAPDMESGIAWDDPDLAIDWELEEHDITNPILSEKDKNRPTLKESPTYFTVKK